MLPPCTGKTSTTAVTAAKPNSNDLGSEESKPTTAKTSAASMIRRGGPMRVISGIASRQPSAAPTRSEKYILPTAGPARPSRIDTMTPNAMNVAKIAKHIVASAKRLLNDERDP